MSSIAQLDPLAVLRTGVDSYRPFVRADGELIDPVYGEPAQYGTPYFALCQAVVAQFSEGADRDERARLALKVCDAALAHVEDPRVEPNLSGVNQATGAALRINHRDFFWPAILKTYRILRGLLGDAAVSDMARRIREVDILSQFLARPPSNWAMVWLSGEWIRMREGLSRTSAEQFDEWLKPYFDLHVDLEAGFYQEAGHPNSYDLFTRYHMQDLLAEGYDGAWRDTLQRLLDSGLRRSLAVQLSDGSMASAYRSTGQTWTLGVQCAYFREVSNALAGIDDGRAERARAAAYAALSSLARFQRRDGIFSPVENVLPAEMRVGYEGYSFDGNYANLALGFLACAILRGLAEPGSRPSRPPHPQPEVLIEHDPIFRAIAHAGPYSVHFNAFPSPAYDGYGIVDVTVGLGRRLQFATSARFMSDARFYNMGIARRTGPDHGEIAPVGWEPLFLASPIEELADGTGFEATSRIRGAAVRYRTQVSVDARRVRIVEATIGDDGYKTLIVPYLRDAGGGHITRVEYDAGTATLKMGDEIVRLTLEAPVGWFLNLPYHFENRRGLCGLLRFDLAEPTEQVAWRIEGE